MARRPLDSMGVEQLEVRFKDSQHDAVALTELENELTHRKTQRAAKLAGLVRKRLAELRRGKAAVGGAGQVPPPKPSVPLTREVESVGATTSGSPRFGLGISVSPKEHLRLLEAIRRTFTDEGEILARWGMTELLDPQIQEAVLGMIRARLTQGSMPDGRGLADLDRDVDQLKVIRSRRSSQSQRGVA